jgi:hypothetical protein
LTDDNWSLSAEEMLKEIQTDGPGTKGWKAQAKLNGPKNKASHPTPDLTVAAHDGKRSKVTVPEPKDGRHRQS